MNYSVCVFIIVCCLEIPVFHIGSRLRVDIYIRYVYYIRNLHVYYTFTLRHERWRRRGRRKGVRCVFFSWLHECLKTLRWLQFIILRGVQFLCSLSLSISKCFMQVACIGWILPTPGHGVGVTKRRRKNRVPKCQLIIRIYTFYLYIQLRNKGEKNGRLWNGESSGAVKMMTMALYCMQCK